MGHTVVVTHKGVSVCCRPVCFITAVARQQTEDFFFLLLSVLRESFYPCSMQTVQLVHKGNCAAALFSIKGIEMN